MTGYSFKEVKGKKPGSLLQGEKTDRTTVAKIRERITGEKSYYGEILNYTKEGTAYWIFLSINPIFDEKGDLQNFVSIQINITNVKQIQLESNSRLEAIELSNAVFEWDQNGKPVAMNEVLEKLLGMSHQEVLDSPQMSLDQLIGQIHCRTLNERKLLSYRNRNSSQK